MTGVRKSGPDANAPSRRSLVLGAPLLAAAAGACTQLQMFDTLMPGDGSVRAIARSVRFAPGARGTMDVYGPTSPAPAGGWPVVVFWYGGSWRSGTKDDYHFAASAYASLGAICVLPDYRLVPEVRHPAFVEDGLAALAAVRSGVAAWGGDPRRIVLAGHSAGAWIAAQLALHPSTAGQLAGWIGLAGPYDFLPLDVTATQDAFGHLSGVALDATQPVRLPARTSPPALLIHGTEDRTVNKRQSEAMAAHLRAAGVSCTLELLPHVGHITILTALARPLRGRAQTRELSGRFLRSIAPISVSG